MAIIVVVAAAGLAVLVAYRGGCKRSVRERSPIARWVLPSPGFLWLPCPTLRHPAPLLPMSSMGVPWDSISARCMLRICMMRWSRRGEAGWGVGRE